MNQEEFNKAYLDPGPPWIPGTCYPIRRWNLLHGKGNTVDLDRDALDRHITGGRYSATSLLVTCLRCGTVTSVLAETDYGFTSWTPAECSGCGAGFEPDEEDQEYTWETAE